MRFGWERWYWRSSSNWPSNWKESFGSCLHFASSSTRVRTRPGWRWERWKRRPFECGCVFSEPVAAGPHSGTGCLALSLSKVGCRHNCSGSLSALVSDEDVEKGRSPPSSFRINGEPGEAWESVDVCVGDTYSRRSYCTSPGECNFLFTTGPTAFVVGRRVGRVECVTTAVVVLKLERSRTATRE